MAQVDVTLNGRSYRFVCGEGDEARIASLAAYVDAKLLELSPERVRPGDDRLLAMVALHIADELFEARARLAETDAGEGRGGGSQAKSMSRSSARRTAGPANDTAAAPSAVPAPSPVPTPDDMARADEPPANDSAGER